jgi:hypothetical protein
MPRKPQLPPKKRVVLPPKKAARPALKPQPRMLQTQHRGGR